MGGSAKLDPWIQLTFFWKSENVDMSRLKIVCPSMCLTMSMLDVGGSGPTPHPLLDGFQNGENSVPGGFQDVPKNLFSLLFLVNCTVLNFRRSFFIHLLKKFPIFVFFEPFQNNATGASCWVFPLGGGRWVIPLGGESVTTPLSPCSFDALGLGQGIS